MLLASFVVVIFASVSIKLLVTFSFTSVNSISTISLLEQTRDVATKISLMAG